MLRIAVVDDNAEDAELICNYLERFFAADDTAYTVSVFSEGEDFLLQDSRSYELLFLDVEMRGANGISIARTIREKDDDLVILFISRIAHYAIQGYSVDALDYLLKPVAYEEFVIKLRKALRHMELHRVQRIRISLNGDYRWLSSDTIRCVEVFGHELIYHTTEGDFRTAGTTIAAAAEELHPYGFLQCSRFSLVNMRFVTGIDGNTLLLGKDYMPVSRRRRKEIVDALLRYHGGVI